MTAEKVAIAALTAYEKAFVKKLRGDIPAVVPKGFRPLSEWAKLTGYAERTLRRKFNAMIASGKMRRHQVFSRRGKTNRACWYYQPVEK